MTTKDLKQLLKDNRNIEITVDNWKLVRKLDSASREAITVENTWNIDKCEYFNADEFNQGVKFFMSKVSYAKSFRKSKNITGLDITIVK
jgi:hypothetical protein